MPLLSARHLQLRAALSLIRLMHTHKPPGGTHFRNLFSPQLTKNQPTHSHIRLNLSDPDRQQQQQQQYHYHHPQQQSIKRQKSWLHLDSSPTWLSVRSRARGSGLDLCHAMITAQNPQTMPPSKKTPKNTPLNNQSPRKNPRRTPTLQRGDDSTTPATKSLSMTAKA
jgi:hypothetical protein